MSEYKCITHKLTTLCIQRKASWALKWCNPGNKSFVKHTITYATIEDIFFSGSFCAIFWLKNQGLMPGLSFSNKLISHDKRTSM